MKHRPSGLNGIVLILGLIMFTTVSQAYIHAGERPAPGQDPKHIASSEEVRAAVTAAAAARGAQIDKIVAVLDSGAVRRQLAGWGISADRIKGAVSRLDESELADLAARADGVLADVLGGHSNTTFILILVAAFLLPLVIALALS
jgi:broad specificity phosphatase PhoE